MPLLKINDQEIEVAPGTTVLEAAKQLGIEIPHYCYHPALKIVASCRMCLVKVQGMPKLVPACSTTVNPMAPERRVDGKYDMVVVTNDHDVTDAQESILEFLLLNHPVDCPECDQAGECLLQDYSYKYGKDHSRFEFQKRVPPRKDLGPNMLLIATRCILCSRCVRFTEEITGTKEIMIKNRGYHAEIDVFPGNSLDNKLSMCTADVCPVGALVTKDFLFKPRNWRYQKERTICPGCSVGCNVQIEFMEEDNRIYRIKPEFNADVNQWWACDDGRLLYHDYEKLERAQFPMIRKENELERSNWRTASRLVQEKFSSFSPDQIAAVGSGYATNEENYLLQKLFRKGLKSENIALNENIRREDDVVYPRFTIKGEKASNLEGAKDTLNTQLTFADILKKIDAGKIKALYYLGGNPHFTLSDADLEILKKLEFLVVQDISMNPLSKMGDVLLPGVSAYEKDGTFTNYQGRVQRIRQTVMPPAAAKPDWIIFQELFALFELEHYLKPAAVFNEISEIHEDYRFMTYNSLGNLGVFKGQGKLESEPVKLLT